MTRLMIVLVTLMAVAFCLTPAFAVEVVNNGSTLFFESFESGTHQAPPPDWSFGGNSEVWVFDTAQALPAHAPPNATDGTKYLSVGNNPAANGYILRSITPVNTGTLTATWNMWVVGNHTDAVGGTVAFRTNPQGENRAGISFNRAVSGNADGNGVDTGITLVPETWQKWVVDYNFNGAGAADDTWQLSIDGVASPLISGGTVGPDNIGEILIAASFRDFFIDAVPEPASLALVGLGGLALLRRRRA